MNLLKNLCSFPAPSGSEHLFSDFLVNYIKKESKKWKVQPEIFYGDGFQNNVALVFGKPKTAVFAHIDSIGFTVGYNNKLVKIGGPVTKKDMILVGEDETGKIETKLIVKKDKKHKQNIISVDTKREIARGTTLTFKPNFRETKNYVQCCYMDNRLGVYNCLKLSETLENGIICFTCWEEHGGGGAEVMARFIYEKYNVSQALISDITWATEGVKAGKGVAVSLRDSGIPRKIYLDKIVALAKKSKIPFQVEVESAGGSDGNAIHKTPYPIDWCFVGAPEQFVHSQEEKVHKKDIENMLDMYRYLMKEL